MPLTSAGTLQQHDRMAVAVSATFSLLATCGLLTYVIILVFLVHFQPKKSSKLPDKMTLPRSNYKGGCPLGVNLVGLTPQPLAYKYEKLPAIIRWAEQRLKFIKTPFGVMFVNLVMADFIQALGFGMNYFWVATSRADHILGEVCTIQGVLIQLGDLASAFSNLMIAIQTFVILTFSWRFPPCITWLSIGIIWVPVLTLTFLPPTIMGNWKGSDPFYTWAGDWCWINEKYAPLRLLLHYLWIFVSAFASIALYGHLFLRLQVHFKKSRSLADPPSKRAVQLPIHSTSSRTSLLLSCASKVILHCKSCLVLPPKGSASKGLANETANQSGQLPANNLPEVTTIPLQGDFLRRRLERKAKAMLMYPIAFIFTILPLSAFRLAALAGHNWGVTAATLCGSIYCLSGFIDVLLFGTTRSIISMPDSFKYHGANPSERRGTTGGGNGTEGGSEGLVDGVSHGPFGFRVQVVQETAIDSDEASELDLQTLKKIHSEHYRLSQVKAAVTPVRLSTGGCRQVQLKNSTECQHIIDLPASLGYVKSCRVEKDCKHEDPVALEMSVTSASTWASDFPFQSPSVPERRPVAGGCMSHGERRQ